MKPYIVHSLHGVDLEDYSRLVRREIDRASDSEGSQGFSDPFLTRHFAREKQKSERKLEHLEKVIRTGIPTAQEMQRVWLCVAGASALGGLVLCLLPTQLLPGKRLAFHLILGVLVAVGSVFTRYRTSSPLAAILVSAALWSFPIMLSFTDSIAKGLLTSGFALGASGKLAVLIYVFDRPRPLSKTDHDLLRTLDAENRPFDDELARINRLPEEERGEQLLNLWKSISEQSEQRLGKDRGSSSVGWNRMWNENFHWFLGLSAFAFLLIFTAERMQGKY